VNLDLRTPKPPGEPARGNDVIDLASRTRSSGRRQA
jgi:hypothetical protein